MTKEENRGSMTTLYIAGPMTGLPENNYPAFRDAASILAKAGYGVLNPVENEKKRTDNTRWVVGNRAPWSWYMRRSLEQIAVADGMAVLPRWQNSKGATLEVDLALQLGMQVATVDGWIARASEGETL